MLKPSVYKPVTLILLFSLSFVIRLIALYQTPYANGWDGCYYIMQMYTFVEDGVMRAPDYSIIYSFFIGLYYLTNDFLLAYKVGCAILAAVFTLTLYFFSFYLITYKQTSKKSVSSAFFISLTIAAFSLFSPTLTYFTAQFPKNLLGLIVLLWFMYFLNEKKVFYLILFFALSFMAHRMSAGLALFVLFFSLLKKQHIWILLITTIIGVAGALLLPGVIHLSDIERFKQVLDLNFPLLELINYFGTDRLSVFWIIELVLLFILFMSFVIVLIYRLLKRHRLSKAYIQLFLILVVLSLPFFKFQNAGLGFRMYLSFNILAIPLLVFVVFKISQQFLIAICLSLTVFSFYSYQAYHPQTLDPPYADYFQVVDALKNKDLDEDALIIAHQGLSQIIIINTTTDATNWQPKERNNPETTYRIAANISYYYFNKYLNKSELNNVSHLCKSYYLMPEVVWQQFKENVYKSDNSSLKAKLTEWYNPSKPKPQYMLKGRKEDYVR